MRGLARSPAFTAAAVLTLGLGIGANTAVFSLINSVLLRPLPFEEPERLALIWESAPFFGLKDSPVSPANYLDWRARARSFQEMGAIEDRGFKLIGDGAPEILMGSHVTAGCLRALRIRPILGRLFRDEEDRPGSAKVALIGEGLWRRRFAADPNVIGKTIRLGEEQHNIVGVLPAGFEVPAEYLPAPGEVWVPFGNTYSEAEWHQRGRHNWMVVARLKPGVSLAQANGEMQAIGAALSREYPGTNEKVGAFASPLREHFVASGRRLLLLLLGTVLFVLLIACSNLANLLLSRTAGRGKEMAVRAALGGGAWQLARQSFCESLLFCLAGGGLGVALALPALQFLAHLAPATITGLDAVVVDWRVLAFTLVVTALTAIAFGLAPLLQLRKMDIGEGLKQSARTLAAAHGSSRLRSLLVCSEVALAFVLMIGAGLLIQTFARLRSVDVGFPAERLLTLGLPGPDKPPAAEAAIARERELQRRVLAIPGVESAGFTNHVPVGFKGDFNGLGAEGRPPEERISVRARTAGPGFFRTMGIPILRGRDIQETDTDRSPRVVIVNERLARALWPDKDPLGRRVIFEQNVAALVVGVARDIRDAGPGEPAPPEYYIPTYQRGYPAMALAVRTKGDAKAMAEAVRRAIQTFDPEQPVTRVATMEEILDQEVAQRRVQTTLLSAFAGLAMALAAVGLYGVLAYLVGRQTPEIGLRMALGAAPRTVLRGVVAHGLKLGAAGVAAGAVAALALSHLLASFLYGTRPDDPATYAAVAAVLLATAALASYFPARRAMRIDPITALREE